MLNIIVQKAECKIIIPWEEGDLVNIPLKSFNLNPVGRGRRTINVVKCCLYFGMFKFQFSF